jgi:AraC-like DNA-binding protein
MMHEIARDIGFDQEPLNVKERQVRHRPLYDAHRRFYRSLEESSTRLERQTLFLDAVRHLLRSCFGHSTRRLQPRPESRAVELVRREIDERHAENLGLEELSKLAGLNRFHLLRTFHAQVGCTPHAYLIDRRLARARELLRRGATPSEAAVDVGFADQSHLTRHFKRFFGVTPALYGKS